MIFKGMKRKVLQQFVNELYVLNRRDSCWDPIGSIDYKGMNAIIEVIARGNVAKSYVKKARERFIKENLGR